MLVERKRSRPMCSNRAVCSAKLSIVTSKYNTALSVDIRCHFKYAMLFHDQNASIVINITAIISWSSAITQMGVNHPYMIVYSPSKANGILNWITFQKNALGSLVVGVLSYSDRFNLLCYLSVILTQCGDNHCILWSYYMAVKSLCLP